MKKNNLVFTFATAEVSPIGQLFIKITELLTGKLTLKKLYDEYLSENRPPEYFWDDDPGESGGKLTYLTVGTGLSIIILGILILFASGIRLWKFGILENFRIFRIFGY